MNNEFPVSKREENNPTCGSAADAKGRSPCKRLAGGPFIILLRPAIPAPLIEVGSVQTQKTDNASHHSSQDNLSIDLFIFSPFIEVGAVTPLYR